MLMNFKKLFIAIVTGLIITHLSFATNPTTLQQIGYINDYTQTLTAPQQQSLSQLSTVIEQKTGIQLATVIIPELGENWTIEDYTSQLFESWGIGQKKLDNGLLLLVALKEKRLRIEVGYGLEGILPDGKAGAIRDQFILPHFKEGNLQKGLISGHIALANTIASEYNIKITEGDLQPHSRRYPSKTATQSSPFNDIILLIIIGIIIAGMIKSPTFRAFIMGMLIASMFSRGGYRRSSMGHFGGGGGFGGFGGGLSGGGGASGGW